jgi:hypothetical protein
MIPSRWWIAVLGTLVALWQETGENPALFCYRIGWDAFSSVRGRSLALVPARNILEFPAARTKADCSMPSFTSSARYLTPRGSRN